MRVHLFPSRTQKLSSFASTILAGRLAGKIDNANTIKTAFERMRSEFLCAPGERAFYRVKDPNPPDSGKGQPKAGAAGEASMPPLQ